MEHRDAHAGLARERVDIEVAGQVRVNAAQRLRDAAELMLLDERRANRVALRAGQHAVRDLAHDRRPEHARVVRRRERFEQAQHRVRERRVERGRIHAARLANGNAAGFVEQDREFRDHREIDADRDREKRLVLARERLAFERQRHRQHQILLRVVDE
ncbi:hypothetical protein WK73_13360 [Burkholderia ubonensis]|nr:hypothetical protein WK73_13360 [Burkholderia ubonensis]